MLLNFSCLFLILAGLLASQTFGMFSEESVDWFESIDLVGARIDYVQDNFELFTPPIVGV